jgi:hypothetical protein
MCLDRHEKAGQNHNVKITNKLFETAEKFRCLGTTVTNQNYIYEEIKKKIKFGECLLPLISESFVFLYPI